MANRIVNTSKQDPSIALMQAMVFGSSNAIELSEKRGQRELCQSDVLPTHLHRPFGSDKTRDECLAEMGIRVLGPVEGDDLFINVVLPEGWKINPTEHPMWSELVDDKGRTRASIFYKAAFYDRRSHFDLDCRYSIEYDYNKAEKEQLAVCHIKDGRTVIHSMEPITLSKPDPMGVKHDEAVEKARQWLLTNYPDYENPLAYWD